MTRMIVIETVYCLYTYVSWVKTVYETLTNQMLYKYFWLKSLLPFISKTHLRVQWLEIKSKHNMMSCTLVPYNKAFNCTQYECIWRIVYYTYFAMRRNIIQLVEQTDFKIIIIILMDIVIICSTLLQEIFYFS